MAKQFLDLTGLATFLNQLKGLFSTKDTVENVEANTNTYILNIDYENNLAFNTSEIIEDNSEDVILNANEAMLLSSEDDIIVDINWAYITVEKGE